MTPRYTVEATPISGYFIEDCVDDQVTAISWHQGEATARRVCAALNMAETAAGPETPAP